MTTSNISSSATKKFSKVLLIAFCTLISMTLFIWSLLSYHPRPILYGPRAIYSIILLSVLLALLGRLLLLRMPGVEIDKESSAYQSRQHMTWRLLLEFDVAAPIYLAAGVLMSQPAAVLTALVTQFCVQGYTLMRRLISWSEFSYRIASTGLLVLISTFVLQYLQSLYHFTVSTPLDTHYLESWALLTTLIAAVVMMILLVIISLPMLVVARHMKLSEVWSEYIHSSVPRFQLLVLSVGPLLPVVDVFDDAVGELAWIFFLVPLLAIYYLALTSTRLSIRTTELQNTVEDLNSARRRQDELRGYASLITRVQEEERRRLARELHDDTAQALIALARGLDGLEQAVEKQDLPRKDRAWLANLRELADHTLDSVRRACRDLRPSILDDLGLRAALEWLCDGSSSRGAACSFLCTGPPLVTPPEAEIAIFRVAQEALSNVWRHAEATEVRVELKYLSNELRLQIRDNGCGFFPDDFRKSQRDSQSGLGLLGMRERAMLIGASLSISSLPGTGCTVLLSLPLLKEENCLDEEN